MPGFDGERFGVSPGVVDELAELHECDGSESGGQSGEECMSELFD